MFFFCSYIRKRRCDDGKHINLDWKEKVADRDETDGTYFKTLTLDVDYYQSFLDDVDIPGDKRDELIETLWAIVVQFVDMGFGIHPLQQAGQQAGQKTAAGSDEPDRIEHHPVVTKMIAQAVNENASNTDNRLTGKLKEAWPERTNTR